MLPCHRATAMTGSSNINALSLARSLQSLHPTLEEAWQGVANDKGQQLHLRHSTPPPAVSGTLSQVISSPPGGTSSCWLRTAGQQLNPGLGSL